MIKTLSMLCLLAAPVVSQAQEANIQEKLFKLNYGDKVGEKKRAGSLFTAGLT